MASCRRAEERICEEGMQKSQHRLERLLARMDPSRPFTPEQLADFAFLEQVGRRDESLAALLATVPGTRPFALYLPMRIGDDTLLVALGNGRYRVSETVQEGVCYRRSLDLEDCACKTASAGKVVVGLEIAGWVQVMQRERRFLAGKIDGKRVLTPAGGGSFVVDTKTELRPSKAELTYVGDSGKECGDTAKHGTLVFGRAVDGTFEVESSHEFVDEDGFCDGEVIEEQLLTAAEARLRCVVLGRNRACAGFTYEGPPTLTHKRNCRFHGPGRLQRSDAASGLGWTSVRLLDPPAARDVEAPAGDVSAPGSDRVTSMMVNFFGRNLSSSSRAAQEDEIHLMALQERLATELGEYEQVERQGVTVFVNQRFGVSEHQAEEDECSVRSWNSQDIAEEEAQEARQRAHERGMLIAMADDIVILQQVFHRVEATTAEAQPAFDAAEAHMDEAVRNFEEAVVHLNVGSDTQRRQIARKVAAASLAGFMIIGGAACHMVGGPVCGAVCMATRGAMVTPFAAAGASAVWRKVSNAGSAVDAVVEQAQEDLPTAAQHELGPETVRKLVAEADVAAAAFLSAITDEEGWQKLKMSVWSRGWKPRRRPSDVRPGGHATRMSFFAPTPASTSFSRLSEHMKSASLVGNCEVSWSRPIDKSTSLRYLVLSNAIGGARDFLCICRAAQLPSADGQPQRFVIALSSIRPEDCDLLEGVGLPERLVRREGTQPCIHSCGVLITGMCGEQERSRVDVYSDVNPLVGGALPQAFLDYHLSTFVLHTAKCLAAMLQVDAARQVQQLMPAATTAMPEQAVSTFSR